MGMNSQDQWTPGIKYLRQSSAGNVMVPNTGLLGEDYSWKEVLVCSREIRGSGCKICSPSQATAWSRFNVDPSHVCIASAR